MAGPSNAMNSRVALHELRAMSAHARAELLRRTEDDLGDFIEKVTPIIDAVKAKGDAALVKFARQFDGADIAASDIAASDDDFAAAYEQLDPEFIDVLRYAADNIRRFHEKQMPATTWEMEIRPGADRKSVV